MNRSIRRSALAFVLPFALMACGSASDSNSSGGSAFTSGKEGATVIQGDQAVRLRAALLAFGFQKNSVGEPAVEARNLTCAQGASQDIGYADPPYVQCNGETPAGDKVSGVETTMASYLFDGIAKVGVQFVENIMTGGGAKLVVKDIACLLTDKDYLSASCILEGTDEGKPSQVKVEGADAAPIALGFGTFDFELDSLGNDDPTAKVINARNISCVRRANPDLRPTDPGYGVITTSCQAENMGGSGDTHREFSDPANKPAIDLFETLKAATGNDSGKFSSISCDTVVCMAKPM